MLIALALFAILPQTQAVDPTLPPDSVQVRYTVEGRGVQIYQCLAQTGSFQWVFQSPEAVLVDTAVQQQVGTHGAGPSWTWTDGSTITGKLLQKSASPEAGSIPWLLLETHSTGTAGALSSITYVRRSDTHAGTAPATGCDARAAAESTTIRVPYVATYTFYSPAQ